MMEEKGQELSYHPSRVIEAVNYYPIFHYEEEYIEYEACTRERDYKEVKTTTIDST